MASLRSWAALAFALGCAVAAPAQAGERKWTFARVVDGDGAALGGLEVTFAGGNPQLVEAVQRSDVVVVQSDARGRVRARLRPDLCYVAWATGPYPEADHIWSAGPHGYFAAGAMFDLSCRPVPTRRLVLGGVEAWQDRGPLRYAVVTPHPGSEIEIEPDQNGELTLPPIAGAMFEVAGADGEPLWSEALGNVTAIPPPQAVRVRAVDENGDPIAGAIIRHRVGRRSCWRVDGISRRGIYRFREVGVTDADGRATVIVPYLSHPLRQPASAEMILLASAPGRAVVAGGSYGKVVYKNENKVEDYDAEELVFELPSVAPIGLAKGLFPPGTVAQLTAICKLRMSANGYMHDPRTFVAVADDSGTLAFGQVPDDIHSLHMFLRLEDAALPIVFPALVGRAIPLALKPGDERSLTARLGGIHLRIRDENGGPARGAIAYVVPAAARGTLQRSSLHHFPLDATGRCSLGAAPGDWVVVVLTDSGYVSEPISVQREQLELDLQLQPMPRMQLRVSDLEGNPAAGARVRITGSRTRAVRDPRFAALEMFSRQVLARWEGLRSDAGGLLSLPILPVPGVTRRARLTRGGDHSDEFDIEAGDESFELVVK